MNERIPKKKKIPVRDNLQQVDINNRDVQHLLRDVNRTCLDTSFSQQWRAVKVSMVHNSSLETSYVKKRCELKESRTAQSIKEALGFLEIQGSHKDKIAREGLQVYDQSFNRLGNGKCGVCLNGFFDVELKFSCLRAAEAQKDIFVFKYVSGKCKTIPLIKIESKSKSAFIDPTPNYDSHISSVRPLPSDPLFMQKVRSSIYIYEYTDDCEPSKNPRQCLPHAIITCVMVHNPAKPVNPSFPAKAVAVMESNETSTKTSHLEETEKAGKSKARKLTSRSRKLADKDKSKKCDKKRETSCDSLSGKNDQSQKDHPQKDLMNKKEPLCPNRQKKLDALIAKQGDYMQRIANAKKELQKAEDSKFSALANLLPSQPSTSEEFSVSHTIKKNDSANVQLSSQPALNISPMPSKVERLKAANPCKQTIASHEHKSPKSHTITLNESSFESDLAKAFGTNSVSRRLKTSKNKHDGSPKGQTKSKLSENSTSAAQEQLKVTKENPKPSAQKTPSNFDKQMSKEVVKSDSKKDVNGNSSSSVSVLKEVKKFIEVESTHVIHDDHTQNLSKQSDKEYSKKKETLNLPEGKKSKNLPFRDNVFQVLLELPKDNNKPNDAKLFSSITSESAGQSKTISKSKLSVLAPKKKELLTPPVHNEDETVSPILIGPNDGSIGELSNGYDTSEKEKRSCKGQPCFKMSTKKAQKETSIRERDSSSVLARLTSELETSSASRNNTILPRMEQNPKGFVEDNRIKTPNDLKSAKASLPIEHKSKVKNSVERTTLIREIRNENVGEIIKDITGPSISSSRPRMKKSYKSHVDLTKHRPVNVSDVPQTHITPSTPGDSSQLQTTSSSIKRHIKSKAEMENELLCLSSDAELEVIREKASSQYSASSRLQSEAVEKGILHSSTAKTKSESVREKTILHRSSTVKTKSEAEKDKAVSQCSSTLKTQTESVRHTALSQCSSQCSKYEPVREKNISQQSTAQIHSEVVKDNTLSQCSSSPHTDSKTSKEKDVSLSISSKAKPDFEAIKRDKVRRQSLSKTEKREMGLFQCFSSKAEPESEIPEEKEISPYLSSKAKTASIVSREKSISRYSLSKTETVKGVDHPLKSSSKPEQEFVVSKKKSVSLCPLSEAKSESSGSKEKFTSQYPSSNTESMVSRETKIPSCPYSKVKAVREVGIPQKLSSKVQQESEKVDIPPRPPSKSQKETEIQVHVPQKPSTKPGEESNKVNVPQKPSSKPQEESNKVNIPQKPSSKPQEESNKVNIPQKPSSKPQEESDRVNVPQKLTAKLREESNKVNVLQNSLSKLQEESNKVNVPQKPSSKLQEESDRVNVPPKLTAKPREESNKVSVPQKPSSKPQKESNKVSVLQKPSSKPQKESYKVSVLQKPSSKPQKESNKVSVLQKPSSYPQEDSNKVNIPQKLSSKPQEESELRANVPQKPSSKLQEESDTVNVPQKPSAKLREESIKVNVPQKPSSKPQEESNKVNVPQKLSCKLREESNKANVPQKPSSKPPQESEVRANVHQMPPSKLEEESDKVSVPQKPSVKPQQTSETEVDVPWKYSSKPQQEPEAKDNISQNIVTEPHQKSETTVIVSQKPSSKPHQELEEKAEVPQKLSSQPHQELEEKAEVPQKLSSQPHQELEEKAEVPQKLSSQPQQEFEPLKDSAQCSLLVLEDEAEKEENIRHNLSSKPEQKSMAFRDGVISHISSTGVEVTREVEIFPNPSSKPEQESEASAEKAVFRCSSSEVETSREVYISEKLSSKTVENSESITEKDIFQCSRPKAEAELEALEKKDCELDADNSSDKEDSYTAAVSMYDLGMACYLCGLAEEYQPEIYLLDCNKIQNQTHEFPDCRTCAKDANKEVLKAMERMKKIELDDLIHDSDEVVNGGNTEDDEIYEGYIGGYDDDSGQEENALQIDLSDAPVGGQWLIPPSDTSPSTSLPTVRPYALQLALSPISSADDDSHQGRFTEANTASLVPENIFKNISSFSCDQQMLKDDKVMRSKQVNFDGNVGSLSLDGQEYQTHFSHSEKSLLVNSSDFSHLKRYCDATDQCGSVEKENVPIVQSCEAVGSNENYSGLDSNIMSMTEEISINSAKTFQPVYRKNSEDEGKSAGIYFETDKGKSNDVNSETVTSICLENINEINSISAYNNETNETPKDAYGPKSVFESKSCGKDQHENTLNKPIFYFDLLDASNPENVDVSYKELSPADKCRNEKSSDRIDVCLHEDQETPKDEGNSALKDPAMSEEDTRSANETGKPREEGRRDMTRRNIFDIVHNITVEETNNNSFKTQNIQRNERKGKGLIKNRNVTIKEGTSKDMAKDRSISIKASEKEETSKDDTLSMEEITINKSVDVQSISHRQHQMKETTKSHNTSKEEVKNRSDNKDCSIIMTESKMKDITKDKIRHTKEGENKDNTGDQSISENEREINKNTSKYQEVSVKECKIKGSDKGQDSSVGKTKKDATKDQIVSMKESKNKYSATDQSSSVKVRKENLTTKDVSMMERRCNDVTKYQSISIKNIQDKGTVEDPNVSLKEGKRRDSSKDQNIPLKERKRRNSSKDQNFSFKEGICKDSSKHQNVCLKEGKSKDYSKDQKVSLKEVKSKDSSKYQNVSLREGKSKNSSEDLNVSLKEGEGRINSKNKRDVKRVKDDTKDIQSDEKILSNSRQEKGNSERHLTKKKENEDILSNVKLLNVKERDTERKGKSIEVSAIKKNAIKRKASSDDNQGNVECNSKDVSSRKRERLNGKKRKSFQLETDTPSNSPKIKQREHAKLGEISKYNTINNCVSTIVQDVEKDDIITERVTNRSLENYECKERRIEEGNQTGKGKSAHLKVSSIQNSEQDASCVGEKTNKMSSKASDTKHITSHKSKTYHKQWDSYKLAQAKKKKDGVIEELVGSDDLISDDGVSTSFSSLAESVDLTRSETDIREEYLTYDQTHFTHTSSKSDLGNQQSSATSDSSGNKCQETSNMHGMESGQESVNTSSRTRSYLISSTVSRVTSYSVVQDTANPSSPYANSSCRAYHQASPLLSNPINPLAYPLANALANTLVNTLSNSLVSPVANPLANPFTFGNFSPPVTPRMSFGNAGYQRPLQQDLPNPFFSNQASLMSPSIPSPENPISNPVHFGRVNENGDVDYRYRYGFSPVAATPQSGSSIFQQSHQQSFNSNLAENASSTPQATKQDCASTATTNEGIIETTSSSQVPIQGIKQTRVEERILYLCKEAIESVKKLTPSKGTSHLKEIDGSERDESTDANVPEIVKNSSDTDASSTSKDELTRNEYVTSDYYQYEPQGGDSKVSGQLSLEKDISEPKRKIASLMKGVKVEASEDCTSSLERVRPLHILHSLSEIEESKQLTSDDIWSKRAGRLQRSESTPAENRNQDLSAEQQNPSEKSSVGKNISPRSDVKENHASISKRLFESVDPFSDEEEIEPPKSPAFIRPQDIQEFEESPFGKVKISTAKSLQNQTNSSSHREESPFPSVSNNHSKSDTRKVILRDETGSSHMTRKSQSRGEVSEDALLLERNALPPDGNALTKMNDGTPKECLRQDKQDKLSEGELDATDDNTPQKSAGGKGKILLSDVPMEALSLARHFILDQLNCLPDSELEKTQDSEIDTPKPSVSTSVQDAEPFESEKEDYDKRAGDSQLSEDIVSDDSQGKAKNSPQLFSDIVSDDSQLGVGNSQLFEDIVSEDSQDGITIVGSSEEETSRSKRKSKRSAIIKDKRFCKNLIVTLNSESESESISNLGRKLKDRSVHTWDMTNERINISSESDQGSEITPSKRKVTAMKSPDVICLDWSEDEPTTPKKVIRRISSQSAQTSISPICKYIVPKSSVFVDKERTKSPFNERSSSPISGCHERRFRSSSSHDRVCHGRSEKFSSSPDPNENHIKQSNLLDKARVISSLSKDNPLNSSPVHDFDKHRRTSPTCRNSHDGTATKVSSSLDWAYAFKHFHRALSQDHVNNEKDCKESSSPVSDCASRTGGDRKTPFSGNNSDRSRSRSISPGKRRGRNSPSGRGYRRRSRSSSSKERRGRKSYSPDLSYIYRNSPSPDRHHRHRSRSLSPSHQHYRPRSRSPTHRRNRYRGRSPSPDRSYQGRRSPSPSSNYKSIRTKNSFSPDRKFYKRSDQRSPSPNRNFNRTLSSPSCYQRDEKLGNANYYSPNQDYIRRVSEFIQRNQTRRSPPHSNSRSASGVSKQDSLYRRRR